MARVVTEIVTVKFSQIVKDAATMSPAVVTKDMLAVIETMSEQLCGDGVIVEVSSEEAGE